MGRELRGYTESIPRGERKSKEGADAYPPLMLLKALLLQKWFRIKSDPELENQIYPVE